MKKTFWGGFVATVAMLLVFFLENTTQVFRVYPLEYFQEAAEIPLWLWLVQFLVIGWLMALLYRFFFRKFLSFIPPYWLRGLAYGVVMGMLLFVVVVMANVNFVTNRLTSEIIGILLATGTYGLVLGTWMGEEEVPSSGD